MKDAERPLIRAIEHIEHAKAEKRVLVAGR
jgi:hypothetical protein